MITNSFLSNINSTNCRTENGALSNSSSSNILVDQFAKAASYRGRDIKEVFNDQAQLWGYNKDVAIRFPFYLRMVTRKTKIDNSNVTNDIQKGQGVKDESFKRLLWFAQNQPDIFYTNLWLLPIIGSWKDLWVLLFMGKEYNISLNKDAFYKLFQIAIQDEVHKDLVKKYLPRIRSTKKCTTAWAKYSNDLAKEFCKSVGWNEVEYRLFKSTGKAHTFQKLICWKQYDKLDFNIIPGKALLNMVKGKFLTNHKLTDKYEKWIMKQPVAKYTGYPFELGKEVINNLPLFKKLTIDKQFNGLVELGKKSAKEGVLNNRNVICAIDRSGSMTATVANGATNAMNVAESMGIYFSSLIEGAFHNWVIKFSQRSEWVQLHGDSFVDRKLSMRWGDCPSNTDFQSVIDSIVRMKQSHPEIDESEFPNTLLVVSDMQFDIPQWGGSRQDIKTNYQVAIQKLSKYFSEKWVKDFMFIWWDCTGRCKDLPQTMNEPGGYMISGFDGSILTMLLGGASKPQGEKPNMLEMIEETLNQEILTFIKA